MKKKQMINQLINQFPQFEDFFENIFKEDSEYLNIFTNFTVPDVNNLEKVIKTGEFNFKYKTKEYNLGTETRLLKQMVFALAFTERDNKSFLSSLKEKTKKFLDLMSLSTHYANLKGYDTTVTICDRCILSNIHPFTISSGYNEPAGEYVFYIDIGNEDYYSDYDPPYIYEVREKANKITKTFSIFGLEEKVIDGEFMNYGRDKHHIFDLTEFYNDFLSHLSEKSKKRILNLESFLKNQREIDEEREKQKEYEKKIAFLKEKKLSHLEKNQLDFLIDSIDKLTGYNIDVRLCNGIVILSQRNLVDVTTSSTVTTYAKRRVYIVYLDDKKILTVPEQSVLWRTTENGLTGNDFSKNIESVNCEENKIFISFDDFTEIIIEVDKAYTIEEPTEHFRKYVEEQVQNLVKARKEQAKKRKIPVVSQVFGTVNYRSPHIGVSKLKYSDDGKSAVVTIYEEIDYRAGGSNIYAIDERVTNIKITEHGIKVLESKINLV